MWSGGPAGGPAGDREVGLTEKLPQDLQGPKSKTTKQTKLEHNHLWYHVVELIRI